MAKNLNIQHLIRWAEREEWQDLLWEVTEDHVGAACDGWEIDGLEELARILGERFENVIGCIFEDLMTRAREDGSNVVDDYLKRRGWKETPTRRRYMEALRDSVMSIYEVSEIVPGQSFLARDLFIDAEPIRVEEKTATRMFKPWDRIAARIVEVAGRPMLTGCLLHFRHAVAENALDALGDEVEMAMDRADELKQEIREARGDDEAPDDTDMGAIMAALVLHRAASMLTEIWLDDVLKRLLGPPRKAFNSDGDEILLHVLAFAFREGVAEAAVRERLAAVPGLVPVDEDGWRWISPGEDVDPDDDDMDAEDTSNDLGRVVILGSAVILRCNSESRAAVGRSMIFDAAGDLLEKPETRTATAQEMFEKARELMAQQFAKGSGAFEAGHAVPEVASDVPHEIFAMMMDDHFRAAIDGSTPWLQGNSPRAMAATAESREDVAAWLKMIENETAHGITGGRIYDFGWMWQELGVTDLRR